MNEYTSYSLSKRLHAMGFIAKHKQAWISHSADSHACYPLGMLCDCDTCKENGRVNNIPAYTFAELWEVLPDCVDGHLLALEKYIKGTSFVVYAVSTKNELKRIPAKSPAEACALMVEWLITNGHMEVSK